MTKPKIIPSLRWEVSTDSETAKAIGVDYEGCVSIVFEGHKLQIFSGYPTRGYLGVIDGKFFKEAVSTVSGKAALAKEMQLSVIGG